MTQLNKSNSKQKSNQQDSLPTPQWKFEAIGTSWEIDLQQPITANEAEKIDTTIKERIEEFDKTYSRFRGDSIISQIAKSQGQYVLPPDSEKLFGLYELLYQLTDGAFTPLIGNTLSKAGYDAQYSLLPQKMTKTPSWEKSISYKKNHLTAYTPTLLDFGAGGKGYLIDSIADLLESNKIYNFSIDAGGDILYKNQKSQPLRVGLEDPQNLTQVIGIVPLSNQSICGSAGNRRKWGNYHHIINPKNNKSVNNILASWVIAKESFIADALSTCLFLVPPTKIVKHFRIEYLILFPDYSFEKSDKFPAELFIK